MLKEQILEALKTKYKAYGLSNDALDRIASLREKTVEKAEDIEGAVADATTLDLIAKEIQRQRDQAIQKNSESQRAFEAYKAAHPEPDKGGEGDKDKDNGQDIASIVKAAVADAVAPLNEKITALETSKSAEAALSTAHSSFFNGDYAKKYKDRRVGARRGAERGNGEQDDGGGACGEGFRLLQQGRLTSWRGHVEAVPGRPSEERRGGHD